MNFIKKYESFQINESGVSEIDEDFETLKSIFDLVLDIHTDKFKNYYENPVDFESLIINPSPKKRGTLLKEVTKFDNVKVTIVPKLEPVMFGSDGYIRKAFLSKNIFENIFTCIRSTQDATNYELDYISIDIYNESSNEDRRVVHKKYDSSNFRNILSLDSELVRTIRILMKKFK